MNSLEDIGKLTPKMMMSWSKLLTKRFNDYAKMNTRSWFGAGFSRKWTPLNIGYNRHEHALYLWGLAPNENVNKKHGVSKRVPWRKTTKGGSDKYKWHGSHYHRVFVRSSEVDTTFEFKGAERKNKKGGFWFSAKDKWEPNDGLFFSKRSHYAINANRKRYNADPGVAGRKYPFPALWNVEDEKVDFVYCVKSVSDKIVSSDDFFSIIDDTLSEVLSMS